MILSEIFTSYSNEKKAKIAFKKLRDEQGVTCKKCQSLHHYWKADKCQYECKQCRFRTTLRSGTLLESSKMPYRYWMIAIALVTATKKSFSALEVQRQLGHKRYEPIWLMMHKIRITMGRRDDKYRLSGYIEMDEGFFESQREEGDKNTGERQVKVLVVAESRPAGKKSDNKSKPEKAVRFIKMRVLDSITKENVNYEVQSNVEPAAKAVTDGKRCYSALKDMLAKHEVVNSKDRDDVSKNLPWVHIAISNAKKMCLGIHHSIKRDYMQNYLNEFCYKFNRRYCGESLFDRLLAAAVEAPWYSF
jgi:hypothetical protein